MERAIETVASAIGDGVGFAADSGILFVVFAGLWAAFAIGLAISHESLDEAWQSIRDLPVIVQGVVWVAFLPVMAGLWIWETSWPLVLRLILIVSVAGWNLLVFLPRALMARP